MADERSNGSAAKPGAGDDGYQQLRRLAALGYQLRATLVAGDRFLALDTDTDRDNAVWLVSTAVALAEEVAVDIDGFAKSFKPRTPDASLSNAVHKLRMCAHQLQASVRAADHFLDQDSSEDRGHGSWLVASAMTLSDRLASETEDLASALKRGAVVDPAPTTAGSPDAAVRRAAAAAAASAASVRSTVQ